MLTDSAAGGKGSYSFRSFRLFSTSRIGPFTAEGSNIHAAFLRARRFFVVLRIRARLN